MDIPNDSVQEVHYQSYKDLFNNYLFINSSYNFALDKAYVFRGEGDALLCFQKKYATIVSVLLGDLTESEATG